MIFKDSLNNILVFKSDTIKSEKYFENTNIGFKKVETIYRYTNLELDSNSTNFNQIIDDYSIRINLNSLKTCEEGKAGIQYILEDFFCRYNSIILNLEVDNVRSVADTTINNVSYKDVFIYSKNNLKNCFSDRTKFLINKKNGLIQFRDNNGVLWTLDN